MSEAKIAVLAKLTAAEGKRDELVALFSTHVQAVEAETGTQVYALHVDTADDVTVWFYEVYTDKASLDAHGTSEAMKALGPKLKGLMAGRPELTMLKPIAAKGL